MLDDELDDEYENRLAPAKGCLTGIFLGALIWVILFGTMWLIRKQGI